MSAQRAYLVSFLAVRRERSPAEFAQKFPGPWLVWEPGAWSVPGAARTETVTGVSRGAPGKGDALCILLQLAPGEAAIVGRDPECDAVINDATFSRQHFRVERTAGGEYAVSRVAIARGGTLDGDLVGTKQMPLRSGATIAAGSVALRFLDAAGLDARLATLPGAEPTARRGIGDDED